MLDRHGLGAALRRAGVADGYFRIEDVHEPSPTPPDFLFVRRTSDEAWETGVYECGVYHVIEWHPSEDAACSHLLRLLT